MTDRLRQELAERFIAVNGTHSMTEADDAYVDEYFVPLTVLCQQRKLDSDTVRQQMLDNLLPLPSYLRSDGTEMVPPDLFALVDLAGGIKELPDWFRRQWSDLDQANEEWTDYLSGQYVCLRNVEPRTMQRKSAIVAELDAELAHPRPGNSEWLCTLDRLVTELDTLELPFTEYDRHRFDGPVSRDTHIDKIRRQFRLPVPTNSQSDRETQ